MRLIEAKKVPPSYPKSENVRISRKIIAGFIRKESSSKKTLKLLNKKKILSLGKFSKANRSNTDHSILIKMMIFTAILIVML
jgi:hypothetical protein